MPKAAKLLDLLLIEQKLLDINIEPCQPRTNKKHCIEHLKKLVFMSHRGRGYDQAYTEL